MSAFLGTTTLHSLTTFGTGVGATTEVISRLQGVVVGNGRARIVDHHCLRQQTLFVSLRLRVRQKAWGFAVLWHEDQAEVLANVVRRLTSSFTPRSRFSWQFKQQNQMNRQLK